MKIFKNYHTMIFIVNYNNFEYFIQRVFKIELI